VWLEKTGRTLPGPTTMAMNIGTVFESGLLMFDEQELGPLLRGRRYEAAGGLPLAANFDAEVEADGQPVEAKFSTIFTPDVWGEPGTDQVPERVNLQGHAQIICKDPNLPMFHVPHHDPYKGLVMYHVQKNDQICEVIALAVIKFWALVRSDTKPDAVPHLETLKRVRRTPGKACGVEPDLVEAYLDYHEAYKAAERQRDMARAALQFAMGDAELGLAGPAGEVTLFEQPNNRIDVSRLRDEQPEIAEEYTKKSTTRVLRHRKPK